MEHSLIMLVYNIKRSIILGVSDLIAKLKKWNSPTTACFVCITNYFRLYKDSITNQLNLLPKTVCIERLYCRLEYVLFENYQKRRFFHSLTLCPLLRWLEVVTAHFRLNENLMRNIIPLNGS
jgi:hypothetical protein